MGARTSSSSTGSALTIILPPFLMTLRSSFGYTFPSLRVFST